MESETESLTGGRHPGNTCEGQVHVEWSTLWVWTSLMIPQRIAVLIGDGLPYSLQLLIRFDLVKMSLESYNEYHKEGQSSHF
jgi:hypothetical protein